MPRLAALVEVKLPLGSGGEAPLKQIITRARDRLIAEARLRGDGRRPILVLNFVPTALETSVIENIKQFDEDLAQKIMDEMFVFDNLMDVDDHGIQLLLREVQSESLIIALKGAQEELRKKIFKNMSQRAAEALKEDLESKGPVRLSEVEAEQKEILKVLRQLADDGQIVLGGKGDDSFV